jgi:hypothetical protein
MGSWTLNVKAFSVSYFSMFERELHLSEVLQTSPARPYDNITIKIKSVSRIGRMIMKGGKASSNVTFYTTNSTRSYPGSNLWLLTKRPAMKTKLHLNRIQQFSSYLKENRLHLNYKALVSLRQPYHLHVTIILKSGSLKLLEPSGPVKACNGIAFPFNAI